MAPVLSREVSHRVHTLAIMLFAKYCAICGQMGESPCPPCLMRLPPPPNLLTPSGLDALFAVFAYEGPGRRLMTALKYRNNRTALQWMASAIASQVRAERAELVTWVPASHRGFYQRGFDTGALLAKYTGRELRLPVRPLLDRIASEQQSRLSRTSRLEGPSIRAKYWAQRSLRVASVIVVDDVSTTGASLTAAAVALRSCGIRHVVGAVAARTPVLLSARAR